jgi:hypothetical protein
MNHRTLFLSVVVLAGGPVTASAGDGAPPAAATTSHDPDAVQYLRALEGAIQRQTDDEAAASVKKLVVFWKDPTVKDATKKPIPGLVAWYARRKAPAVALAGIDGLADIGKGEGAQNLVAVLDVALEHDDTPAQVTAAVFAALKKVADPDPAVTGAIVKLFLHRDNAVVAKAADTFGGYGAAPAEARRGLFETMLRNFEGLASQAQATGKAANKSAQTKWVAVGGAVLGAMNALSHQQLGTIAAARQWFNDHHKNLDAWT